MSATIQKEKENVIKIDIIIPAQEAEKAYDTAVKRFAQYVNIDGFRRGKAPKAVVERHVGIERIKQEAIESLMPKAMSDVIRENELDLITQPYISDYTFNVGEDLKVVAKAETRPEVTLGQYKDLSVDVEEDEIPSDGIQKSIDALLQQNSKAEKVEGRPSKDTDIVLIDFEGTSNGEKIKGGEAKNYSLDLGHSNFIPGFAEQLVGKNAGDEFDIEVKFPDEYHDEKLKGQPATFKIKIHEIRETKLPELNDEFVQKVSSFKNVDELKADIQNYLEEKKKDNDRINSENAVFNKIMESTKVDIPESMIEREVATLKEEYIERLKSQGLSWEAITQLKKEEEIMSAMKDDALNRIKNSLVLDKIAKLEGIKLEQKDFEAKFNELAAAYRMSIPDLLKQFGGNAAVLNSISQQALNEKVRDFFMTNNKVVFTKKK
jgi:trigger factor